MGFTLDMSTDDQLDDDDDNNSDYAAADTFFGIFGLKRIPSDYTKIVCYNCGEVAHPGPHSQFPPHCIKCELCKFVD